MTVRKANKANRPTEDATFVRPWSDCAHEAERCKILGWFVRLGDQATGATEATNLG